MNLKLESSDVLQILKDVTDNYLDCLKSILSNGDMSYKMYTASEIINLSEEIMESILPDNEDRILS